MNTVNDIIDNCTQTYGTKYLIKDGDNYMTYRGFGRCVKRYAWHLAKNYPKGTRMAVVGVSCLEGFMAWASVVCSGNIAVLCQDRLDSQELARDLQNADVKLVLCNEGVAMDAIRAILPDMETLDLSRLGLCQMHEDWPIKVAGDDDAEILYTSGSTGKAKMVRLSHRAIVHNALGAGKCVHVEQEDVLLSVLPLYHAFGMVAGVLTPMLKGATICFDGSLLKMRRRLKINMKKYQPTILVAVPEIAGNVGTWAKNAPDPSAILGNLRKVVVGGAAMPLSTMESLQKLGLQVVEGYGITECGPIVSCNREEAIVPGSVGKPLDGVEVAIVDGEILVKGPNVMKGYYKDDKANEEAFANGYFKTGDLGRFDEDGHLYITGRKKNLIILANGENVAPESLEGKLKRINGIQEAVVYGKDNRICAILHIDKDAEKTAILSAIGEMNQQLETFRQINRRCIEFTDKPFPKTPTGKIDRKKAIEEPITR